ncbi:MAG: hypothetical protein ACYC56_04160 [Candidatus Aquicultor sp.]
MEERRQEARAVPESERMMANVTPMTRGGYVPAWYSRLSWGSIFAGVLVAIASEFVLSAIGVVIGFGTPTITSAADLRSISAGVGIWAAISILIATFIGGYVASRVADVQLASDGLWHGLVVWAFALVGGILFGVLGVSGLLGFVGNAVAALRGVLPSGATITPTDIRAAADTLASSAGYFLLGSLLSLATAFLGGWLGSNRLSRAEAMKRAEAERTRMAA